MKSSLLVANRFLDLAKQKNDSLTPMQLIKLVYIAHGWMLGMHGRPLIKDEVQAWQYGPVIQNLYNVIKNFRSQPVVGPLETNDNNDLDETESDIVDQTYNLYGHYSGPALSRITHAPGTPWTNTYSPGAFGKVISNDIIEDHYQILATRQQ
jgi:uncharacterized phage-associated protein